jgi:A/G-specific adenine glycosylase
VSLPAIHSAVLEWYAGHGRDLAFRRTRDPWAILVSEVMVQQTQAARAADAWLRFMVEFPMPAALAAASPAAVIRAWRGLGYNRRATALRRAAIAIVEQHNGHVPDSLEALEALPGIGPYTARAVLAFAFRRPVAPLDTNVARVLGRALGALPVGAKARQAAADGFVPNEAAAWAHALMDIGATICVAREPRCDSCPLRDWCREARSARAATGSNGSATKHRNGDGPVPRFESTNRWLRGRILDRLRDAADGAWINFDQAIGGHELSRVLTAIDRMAVEGLIERRADGRGCRLRVS